MPDLPRLEPLPLPYLVSPSVPFLEVTTSENATDPPTMVDFYATHVDGASSRARLALAAGLGVRFSPSHGDRQVVPEASYDWSAVPRPHAGPGYVERERQRREQWQTTGTCPDPRAYEVVGSRWLPELVHPVHETLDGALPYRHYLVLGHDAYVEVLATGWRLEELSEPRTYTLGAG